MAETIRGINVVIGAETTGLQKALSDVNKASRDIQSELKQVERLLKFDPKNTELLAQKKKLLAEAVATTTEKLNRLKGAQEQVNQQFAKGEISEGQYRAFQREVVKTEQELKKLEDQARKAGVSLEDIGKAMEKAGERLSGVGKKLSTYVTAPLLGVGAASFKMAADLQDAMGATDQIFKNAADSVKKWADGLESYYGIAESEALEYANMMGSMLQNIGGLTEEEAAKQAQTLIELAGDLTAMYGGTTADAVRALTGALKGNNTMLDNYGMAVNDAMVKTKAMELGLYDGTGQMDLAAKQAATLALIMEQTGAAQGQAAREAEGASGGMRALATEIKNIATDIGEVLLPIITPWLTRLGELVKRFSELSPEQQEMIVKIGMIAAAIGPALLIIGKLVSVVGTIISAFSAASGAITAAGGVIALLTSPIGIAIAATAALVAAGIAIWKNWDTIKEKLAGIWNSIKETAGKVWDGIVTAIKAPINLIIGAINVLIRGLNKIKFEVPKWVPLLGGKGWGFNIPEIPKLAAGGIVTRPTIAMIGERGPEAVVPLGRESSMSGQLADAVYRAVRDGMATERATGDGGQMTVIVNVGEDTLTERVIRNINRQTRLSGQTLITV